MPYKDRLLAHLGQYRREVLGVQEAGVYRHKGKELAYEHILPKEHRWLGIPEEVRDHVQAYVTARSITLHKYFHHLNSSQAFTLSLFVPFFEGDATAQRALLRALGVDGELEAWQPELVPDAAEGTNLDAWWRTTDGQQFFCEVKLTEQGFGGAANDDPHLAKLRDIYAPRLSDHLDASLLEPEAFFRAYQILRNLWHAAGPDGGTVLFLFPRQQDVLTRELDAVLVGVKEPLRGKVRVHHTEDVLSALSADPECPRHLRQHARSLAEKYLLDVSVSTGGTNGPA